MASYFLPSYVQKRLLRYAISRTGFVDADALGLDKLDIKWGQRNKFEFRDVGLHVEVRSRGVI
jgi:autophagy-related protein 2